MFYSRDLFPNRHALLRNSPFGTPALLLQSCSKMALFLLLELLRKAQARFHPCTGFAFKIFLLEREKFLVFLGKLQLVYCSMSRGQCVASALFI